MLAFRSEEHVERWCETRRMPRGALLTPEQQWRLAVSWYGNRLDPGWHRRTPEETETAFAAIGLEGPFWQVRRS